MHNTTPEITPAQAAAIIQATPQTLRTMLEVIDPEIFSWHPSPDSWCINDIIGHLIAADIHAFAARVKGMLAETQPDLPNWSATAAAAQRDDCQRDTFELLEELAQGRKQYAALITPLSAAELNREGNHKEFGPFKVSDFVYEWAYHDYSHIAQIGDNIRAHIWPSFSSTMQNALHE